LDEANRRLERKNEQHQYLSRALALLLSCFSLEARFLGQFMNVRTAASGKSTERSAKSDLTPAGRILRLTQQKKMIASSEATINNIPSRCATGG
jgi:hypothetical protein